jgi:GcrA cell cycle regulator
MECRRFRAGFTHNRLSPEQILDRAQAQARGRRTTWTSAALDYLSEHYGRVTATEIAVRLGVSRSAIIGKAHRLGLCLPEPAPEPPPVLTEAEALPLRPGLYCGQPVEQSGSAWCERHRRSCLAGRHTRNRQRAIRRSPTLHGAPPERCQFLAWRCDMPRSTN